MPTKVYVVETTIPGLVHHQSYAGDDTRITKPFHPKITLATQDYNKIESATLSDWNKVTCGSALTLSPAQRRKAHSLILLSTQTKKSLAKRDTRKPVP